MKKILYIFAALTFMVLGAGNAQAAVDPYLAAIDKTESKVVLEGAVSYSGGTLQLLMKKNSASNYFVIHEIVTNTNYAFDGSIGYSHTVANLEPNTSYDFLLKKSNEDNNQSSVVKTTVTTTLNPPTLKNFSKKYVEPGEITYFNGSDLDPSPDYVLSDYLSVQMGGECDLSSYSNYPDTCMFGRTEKSDGNKVSFKVPDNAKPRSGKVTLKQGYHEWPPKYDRSASNLEIVELYSIQSEEELHVICKGCMPRTIESKYTDGDYRHLVNSLDYRYGLGVSGREFITKEQRAAKDFRSRMDARRNLNLNFHIDALWFLNLFQSSYYGGYSDEDIENEIIVGPGVVHTQIPKSAWKNTSQYKDATKKAEGLKN